MNAYHHRLVFAAACVGILVVGIVVTTLGAVLPSIIERMGLDRTEAGSLLSLMTLGILAGSLVFGPVVDRRGYKGMLAAGVVLIAMGLEGIAFAPSIALLAVAAIIIGSAVLILAERGDGKFGVLSALGFIGIFATAIVIGVLALWNFFKLRDKGK